MWTTEAAPRARDGFPAIGPLWTTKNPAPSQAAGLFVIPCVHPEHRSHVIDHHICVPMTHASTCKSEAPSVAPTFAEAIHAAANAATVED